jgi:regulator of cell morphogenesis and NO signaling
MTPLTLDSAVGDWAAQRPAAIDIFQKYGIDFCCHGRVSLAVACCERGLDPRRVLNELDQAPAVGINSGRDWSLATLTDLCDHVERTHHAFLREQLPRLADWLDKVVAAHADRHPELADVRRTFHELRGELEPHMLKEERILFPAIRALERAASPPAFPFGSVSNPIGMMEDDHDRVGVSLARLRELTHGYQVPEDACHTYRALLDGLRRLEADLHVHIHKENNILFPRAANLESSEPAAVGA